MRVSIIFLFLSITINSSGQNATVQIKAKWLNLKAQLQKRSNDINNLTKVLSKSKIDETQINTLKKAVIELSNHIDTLQLVDSLSISLTEERNNNVGHAIRELLIAIDNRPEVAKTQIFIDFQMLLEGSENRIAVATYDYNETCKKFQRIDLIFHRTKQREAPEIKF